MSDAEILMIATPIMDNLMLASGEIDHKKHTQHFSNRLKAIVTPSYLEKVCNEYQATKGFFNDRKFIALFKRTDSVAIIWKQTFTLAKGEYVAEMVLIYKNGEYQVDHVMVF